MKRVKRFSALFLCIIIAALCVVPAFAEKQSKSAKTVIKVAFYPLDGFFEYDENGNEVGYGVDYLNELKKYADIEWKYVPVDSWEGIKAKMESGEVDVRMPVSEPVNSSASYSNFTTEPLLMTYHAIMTKTERKDLYYKDYDSIKNMRIGVSKNLVERTGMRDYLSSIGVSKKIYYFEDYNSCRTALDKGEIDGLISNVMDLTSDMKILDRFCMSKTYITTLKNNPKYTIINRAMTELALENPSFQSDLAMEYYPQRTIEPFTKEESEYMAKTKSLTVGVYTDRKPVCYYDKGKGQFCGIAIDIANQISKNINIEFNYVPITTAEPREMLNKIDLIMPVLPEKNGSEYFATQSVVQSEIMLMVKNGGSAPAKGDKVGVLENTTGIRDLLKTKDEWNVITYASTEEALKALKNGKISAFANSSYVVNWLVENPRYENLHVLRYQSLPIDYSFCGNASNTVLQSVLTKGIQSVNDRKSQI